MSINFIKPRGTEDVYYQYANNYQNIVSVFTQTSITYGFSYCKTPIIEHKNLFVRSVGQTSDIVNKEFYEITDKSGRELVLRPEGTAGVIRSIVENKLLDKYPNPLKLFYIEPMFRYERPQSGRLRQFTQCGIECVNTNSYMDDVEIIALAYNFIVKSGVKNFNLSINNIGNIESRKKWINDLSKYFKKFSKELSEDSIKRINQNPLRILDDKVDGKKDFVKKAPKIDKYLSAEELSVFEKIKQSLDELKIPYKVDSSMVRGLDYYTNLVFEINSTSSKLKGQPTLLGGGRYGKLVSDLGGKDVESTGFACGIERLIIAINDENSNTTNPSAPIVYIANLAEESMVYSAKIAEALRKKDIKCFSNFSLTKLKSHFTVASRVEAKYILLIGTKELASKVIVVKNQTTMQQTTVKLPQLIKLLTKGN